MMIQPYRQVPSHVSDRLRLFTGGGGGGSFGGYKNRELPTQVLDGLMHDPQRALVF